MRITTWERYIPDVDDNRAKLARGEPAWSVMVRAPSARLWWEFTSALGGQAATLSEILLLHESAALGLWTQCVGAVEGFPDIGVPVPDGLALWGLRDQLDSPTVYLDIMAALFARTHLEAGLADFLASAPGPAPSRDPASTPPGTAATAEGAG